MGSKPETLFTNALLKRLPDHIYVEKQYNPLRGGTYDLYIEGQGRVLWVEMKFTAKLPPVLDLMRQTTSPKLSPLQQGWGERLVRNSIPNAVITGWQDGRKKVGFIMIGLEFRQPFEREYLLANQLSLEKIASWIKTEVTCTFT